MPNVKVNTNKEGKVISYRVRACVGRDENGKQVFSTKTVQPPIGLTPAKALKKVKADAEQWEESIRKGFIPVEKRTFKYFIENEFIPLHVRNGKHSPGTVFFYSDICKRLVEYFGNRKLETIGSLDIEKYLNTLISVNGYSPNYATHFRTVLVVIFNYAYRHDLIERNPMKKVDPIKRERIDVDFLPEQEALAFLKALRENANLYWKTAMNIFAFMGLRRGELCGLQWKDIDFENASMRVERDVINNAETGRKNLVKETKSESSDRTLPVPPEILNLLKARKAEQEGNHGKLFPNAFIFGSTLNPYEPIRPDSVTQWLDRFCNRFGEKYGFHKVSPHDLRHTCGSLMIANNVPVKDAQLILGHSDASVTLKFYVGSNHEQLSKSLNTLASALSDAN